MSNKKKILNLALHEVLRGAKGDWQISPRKLSAIINWCQKNVDDFFLYFDDGKRIDLPQDILAKIGPFSKIAVVTDAVGTEGHLSWDNLGDLSRLGFTIVSHGATHAALCKYGKEETEILSLLPGGKYESADRGKKNVLSENQVKYQIVESAKTLALHGFHVNEFVFPYGLYSPQVIRILDDSKIYKYYATCDPGIYTGGKLIPRVLIYGNKTVREEVLCLTKYIKELK